MIGSDRFARPLAPKNRTRNRNKWPQASQGGAPRDQANRPAALTATEGEAAYRPVRLSAGLGRANGSCRKRGPKDITTDDRPARERMQPRRWMAEQNHQHNRHDASARRPEVLLSRWEERCWTMSEAPEGAHYW